LLPITSRPGNDRNVNTEVLDFMHDWMTSQHEGCVSAMLTESDLSIALQVRRFKRLSDKMKGARQQSPCDGARFVLTTDRLGQNTSPSGTLFLPWRRDCADDRSRGLQRIGPDAGRASLVERLL
jgi:hypothetical protein